MTLTDETVGLRFIYDSERDLASLGGTYITADFTDTVVEEELAELARELARSRAWNGLAARPAGMTRYRHAARPPLSNAVEFYPN